MDGDLDFQNYQHYEDDFNHQNYTGDNNETFNSANAAGRSQINGQKQQKTNGAGQSQVQEPGKGQIGQHQQTYLPGTNEIGVPGLESGIGLSGANVGTLSVEQQAQKNTAVQEQQEQQQQQQKSVEDQQEDEMRNPSGAFANVGQGLEGKYKNLMMQYWQDTINSIEKENYNFKNHQLPLARIKKVMKTDEDVKMISAEAPILFAKGCDIFITELTMRAWIHAEENKRRTLQKSDIAAALQKSDMFDFLIDIVPRVPEKPKRKHSRHSKHDRGHSAANQKAETSSSPSNGPGAAFASSSEASPQNFQITQPNTALPLQQPYITQGAPIWDSHDGVQQQQKDQQQQNQQQNQQQEQQEQQQQEQQHGQQQQQQQQRQQQQSTPQPQQGYIYNSTGVGQDGNPNGALNGSVKQEGGKFNLPYDF